VIDDLIRMETTMPPIVTEDLASVDLSVRRLTISGATRNLDRLAEMRLEAMWIGDVNEARFSQIVSLIDPEYVMFHGVRVADLSPICPPPAYRGTGGRVGHESHRHLVPGATAKPSTPRPVRLPEGKGYQPDCSAQESGSPGSVGRNVEHLPAHDSEAA